MKTAQRTWVRRLALVAVVLVAFASGLGLRGGSTSQEGHAATEEKAKATTTWTCSMHPQIQLPSPGQCPICGMDLIPLPTSHSDTGGPRSLSLSPHAQAIAEIQTTPATRRDVRVALRMVGKLEPNESRVREISAWVPGRIDKLYIDYTGTQVRKNQKLFDLYSPDLYSAQEELLQAKRAWSKLSSSGLETTRRSATRTINAAREKLRLSGLTADQIADMESSDAPSEHVTIVSPVGGTVLHKDAREGSYVKTGAHVYTIADLSVLWLKLDAYESDISQILLGQSVHFTTDAFSGEEFEGVVSFIDPTLDERSRTIKVRVDVENSEGRLKPGMFARAIVHADIRTPAGGQPLVIPKTAPLITGTRAVVYVADTHEPGQFHGREIVLGPETGDDIVVREGLTGGEVVVSNGAFKIDSALQILAKTSMMNPERDDAVPPQDHGDTDASATNEIKETSDDPVMDVPDSFRVQLDGLLAVYFDLSEALSQDDFQSARTAALKLPEAIAHPQRSLLPNASHAPWAEIKDSLDAAAERIATANDISAARLAFYDLSVTTIRMVRQFHASGSTPVLIYHCPMAMDGAGADWLQMKKGTENPYYGSQMFKCGSETETLIEGANAETEADSGHPNH